VICYPLTCDVLSFHLIYDCLSCIVVILPIARMVVAALSSSYFMALVEEDVISHAACLANKATDLALVRGIGCMLALITL